MQHIANMFAQPMSEWSGLTLQAVSWTATELFPGKKVHGLTKLKTATVRLDFGSKKWEGEMQYLNAGISKAVYALSNTSWVLKVAPHKPGWDLEQTLRETMRATTDDKAAELVPRYLGGLVWTGDMDAEAQAAGTVQLGEAAGTVQLCSRVQSCGYVLDCSCQSTLELDVVDGVL